MASLPEPPPSEMTVNELIAKLLGYPPNAKVTLMEGYHESTLSIGTDEIMFAENPYAHEGED